MFKEEGSVWEVRAVAIPCGCKHHFWVLVRSEDELKEEAKAFVEGRCRVIAVTIGASPADEVGKRTKLIAARAWDEVAFAARLDRHKKESE